MALTARAVLPGETDRMLALMCRSFHMDETSARRIFYADPFYNLAHKRVLVDGEGALVSCLTLIPSRIALGNGVSLPICGVAGVCTEPDLRGRGYAAELIDQTMLQSASEFDFAAAALTAARPDYYEKLGWATCGDSVELTLPAVSIAKRYPCSGNVRILSIAEMQLWAPAIWELYRRSVADSAFRSFERGKERWRCIEQSPAMRRIAAVLMGGKLTAYAAFSVTGSDLAHGAKTMVLQELVADNPDDERALLGCLARMPSCIEVQGFFSAAQAAEILARDYENASSQQATPVLLRAVKLPELATAAATADQAKIGVLTPLQLTLGILPNQSRKEEIIRIEITGGIVSIAPAAHKEQQERLPRLCGNRGAITQLIFGYRSARQLLASGAIELQHAPDESPSIILDACDAIFPSRNLFLAPPDWF